MYAAVKVIEDKEKQANEQKIQGMPLEHVLEVKHFRRQPDGSMAEVK